MHKAYQDLHKRLSHLTSFVSGMIVLAAEGEGHQQAFAGEFLASQGSDCNLAYIKATAGKEAASYRQQLASQLMGNISLDPRRPLNHSLMKLLERDPQPVLIFITGANHLPVELILELWNTVQQLSEQQFCVVLVGSNDWASYAQQKLPGPGQPVLLTHDFAGLESVSGSELDRLIAEKRKAFNARLAARNAPPMEKARSALQSGWMKVALSLIFVVSFVGLMAFLYRDSLSSIWLQSSQIVKDSSAPINKAQMDKQATSDALSDSVTTDVPVAEDIQLASVSAVETLPDKSSQADELVSDWQSLLEKMQPAEESVESEPPGMQPESDASLTEPVQVVAPPVQQPDMESAQIADQAGSVPAQSAFAWDEEKLLALPPDTYLLQLSAASDVTVLNGFIQANQLAPSTWRYQTLRYGGPWYVLLAGESFASLALARSAVSGLPQVVQRENPFAKTAKQVQEEIQRTAAQ